MCGYWTRTAACLDQTRRAWWSSSFRFRRALFPGYSDTVEYTVEVPAELSEVEGAPTTEGHLTVDVRLMYRKVDQFLINFLLGEDSGLTAPVVEMARTSVTVPVVDMRQAKLSAAVETRRVGG